MWKLEIFGLTIQLMLLISIFDVKKEEIFFSEVTLQRSPIAENVIVFVISGLGQDMVDSTKNIIGKNIQLIDRFNVTGKIISDSPITSKNCLTAITCGINEGILSLVPHGRKLDSIFDRVNSTIYFGPKDSLEYFKLNQWDTINASAITDNEKYSTDEETFLKLQLSINKLIKYKLTIVHLKKLIESKNTYECLFDCAGIIKNIFDNILNIINLIERKTDKFMYFIIGDHGMIVNGKYVKNILEETNTFLAILSNTGLKDIKNFSIKQEQLANLISTVLGVELPKNSLAITPISLLNITKNESIYHESINALHLTSLTRKSTQQVELLLKFLNYLKLEPFNGYYHLFSLEKSLISAMKKEDFKEMKLFSNELLELAKYGLDVMKFGMKLMVMSLIHAAYIGWILLLLTSITLEYLNELNKIEEIKINNKAEGKAGDSEKQQIATPNKMQQQPQNVKVEQESSAVQTVASAPTGLHRNEEACCIGLNTIFILIGLLSFIFVIAHNWPLHYYFYWLIPMIIWRYLFNQLYVWRIFITKFTLKDFPLLITNIMVCLITVETLFWSIPYKMLIFIALFLVTLYLTINCMLRTSSPILLMTVVSSGMMQSVILFVPIKKKLISLTLLNISGFLWILTGIVSAFIMRFTFYDYIITVISILHYICSLILINITIFLPTSKEYITSWWLLGTTLVLPLFGGRVVKKRITQFGLCIASSFLLFTTRHESFVLFILFIFCYCWLLLETEYERKEVKLTNIDLSLIFVVLIFTSYHLTGYNLDLNYTNVKYLRRFLPEANQLFQVILIILKHCLILLMLQVFFTTIIKNRGEDMQFLLTIFLINLIGYRYILELLIWPDMNIPSKQIAKHCFLQISAAFLLSSFSFAKLVTRMSILSLITKIKHYTTWIFGYSLKKE